MFKSVERIRKIVKDFGVALTIGYTMAPVPAYAASYTRPVDNLKVVLLTISGSVGMVLLVIGAIRFAIAFQKLDQNGEHIAIYTIVAAGILIGIPMVVSALS